MAAARTSRAERLGRLGQEDALARHRALDHDGPRAPGGACQLHRVARRERRQRRARFHRGVDRARDEIGARERARRVVDDHDVRAAADGVEPVSAPSPAAARRRRRRATACRARARSAGDVRGQVRRQHHDDLVDALVLREQLTERCRIDSPPIVSSCFGTPAPRRSPRPPAAMIATTRMSAHPPIGLPASSVLGQARRCHVQNLRHPLAA